MKKSVSILMIGMLFLTVVVGSLPVTAQDNPQEPVAEATPVAESAKAVYLPLITNGQGNGSAEQVSPEMMSVAEAALGGEVQLLSAEKAADAQDDTSEGKIPPAPGLEPAQTASNEEEKVAIVDAMVEAAAVDGWVTIKSEGFEGAFPNTGWQVLDNDGRTNGEYYWDDTSYTRYAGSWSAWPAKGGANGLNPSTYNYANNMRSWMIYGPFSLSDASDANLQFYYRNQSEANYDYFQWLASVNGTNFYGYQTTGDSGGWRSVNFDLKSVPTLGNLMGRSAVWIAFYFGSDGSITQKGPFVDSITLQKLVNTSVSCPNQYKAEYFNNRTLSGSPAVTRCENWPINQNWGEGSPVSSVGSDNFSVRWTGTANINAGAYTFRATADDGIRVWLDNALIIDAWRDQGPTTYEVNRTVSSGAHSIKVEYYENGGGAVAQFAWSPAAVTCPNQYKAEYFNNRTLSGSPTVTRCENWPINYNWGEGSPVNGVGSDNFSVRWTGTASINTGTYNFVAVADDGIRVWLDNVLKIDAWQDQGPTPYLATTDVSSGNHTIKVEYYENGGGALAQFRWLRSDTRVSTRQGFDACVLPTTGQMQTWWNSSPYREANIYVGGVNRGCNAHNQQNLTASWVSTVRNQGWNLIPTWVGLQAPCSQLAVAKMSSDPNTAYNQGRQEADAAANAVRNLGLTPSEQGGTIIYYDMEGYPNQSSCRLAVKNFMMGWVGRLHELGNRAGGYGSSCASYIDDWSQISPFVPDDIWPAHWIYSSYNAGASVWNVSCIVNEKWNNHQRIRQYAGGHSETWGGVALNIDSNAIDGHVAGTNSRSMELPTEIDRPAQTSTNLEAVQLLSPNVGWLIMQGKFLWTSDSGKTWLDRTPKEHALVIRTAYFLDSSTGWVTGEGLPGVKGDSALYIGKTNDGGSSWHMYPLSNFTYDDLALSQGMVKLTFLDTNSGYMQIKRVSSINFDIYTLLKTSDGGATWQKIATPAARSVHFSTPNTGWTTSDERDDKLYVTFDGGLTWEQTNKLPADNHTITELTNMKSNEMRSRSSVSLSSVIDNNTGWILVDEGLCSGTKLVENGSRAETFDCMQYNMLLSTKDGGITWFNITPVLPE